MTGLDERPRTAPTGGNGYLPTAIPGLTPGEPVLTIADPVVVRQVRSTVAERLAERLQAHPVESPEARRELARSLVAAELGERGRDRVRRGEEPWPVEVEMATGRAVMAALFGLGRLQPLIDDPAVENIEVDGHDQVWVSYADGRDEQHPPVAESDAELIEIVKEGDKRAFDVLVSRHQQMVTSILLRMMDLSDAQDVAQEAFVKAYRSINSFRGDSQFATWLYRIASNTAMNHLKGRKRRPSALHLDALDPGDRARILADFP